ncbi:MAG: preprotein translocase subunit YajC [Clostridia bacterium]|nr:preprotein translocase subunit YajC [Clostridia bacterium]
MKFLLEEAASTGITSWILPAVLLVLVIGIFVLNYFRSKKTREEMKNVINNIKVGDKVKTYSGFYGKIVEITETTDGKVATIQTGDDKHKSYISIDMNAIYGVDNKEPITLDADGNIIETEKKDDVVETKQEPTAVEEKPELEKKVKTETKKKTNKAKKEN